MPPSIFATAVLSDLCALASGYDLFGITGFYNLAAGLVVGSAALAIVAVEVLTSPVGAPCRELVGIVCAAMTVMVGLCALVWSVRADGPRAGNPWLLAVEIVAVAVGAFGAWLGHGVVIGRHRREPVR